MIKIPNKKSIKYYSPSLSYIALLIALHFTATFDYFNMSNKYIARLNLGEKGDVAI